MQAEGSSPQSPTTGTSGAPPVWSRQGTAGLLRAPGSLQAAGPRTFTPHWTSNSRPHTQASSRPVPGSGTLAGAQRGSSWPPAPNSSSQAPRPPGRLTLISEGYMRWYQVNNVPEGYDLDSLMAQVGGNQVATGIAPDFQSMQALVHYPDAVTAADTTKGLHGGTGSQEKSQISYAQQAEYMESTKDLRYAPAQSSSTDTDRSVEARSDQTQIWKDVFEFKCTSQRRLDAMAEQQSNLQKEYEHNRGLLGDTSQRRSELESVMGPTHLMALSAEGLKYCAGGSEQGTRLSTRFRQQVKPHHPQSHSLRLLAKELWSKGLLDKRVTVAQLADRLDNVIDERSKHIHVNSSPSQLDTRMEDTRALLLSNPTLARQHQDCAMVIKNWQILKRSYKEF